MTTYQIYDMTRSFSDGSSEIKTYLFNDELCMDADFDVLDYVTNPNDCVFAFIGLITIDNDLLPDVLVQGD